MSDTTNHPYAKLTAEVENIIAQQPLDLGLFGPEGLRAYAVSLVDARVLDGLSDPDANAVTLATLYGGFINCPHRLLYSIEDALDDYDNRARHDSPLGVCAALSSALNILVAPLAGTAFDGAA
jgi:hypothetical protein